MSKVEVKPKRIGWYSTMYGERMKVEILDETAAPEMIEALNQIMSLDDSGPLDAMAYSGGDIPKKWLREEAPALEARSKARREVKDIIRKALAKPSKFVIQPIGYYHGITMMLVPKAEVMEG